MFLLSYLAMFSQVVRTSEAARKKVEYKKLYNENFFGQKTNELLAEGKLVSLFDINGKLIDTYRTGDWIIYYDEEDIFVNTNDGSHFKGEYEVGLKTGTWKKYGDNGKLKLEVEYSKGKKNGKYIIYSENGNIGLKGEYKNDLKVNRWLNYNGKGEIYSEENYDKNGNKNGKWNMANYLAGNHSIGEYSNNERIGIWKVVDDKTTVTTQTIDYSKCISTNYFSNGKILSQLFYFYAPDNLIGFYNFVMFNENGSKRLEGNFNSSVTYKVNKVEDLIIPNGIWTSSWEDGLPAVEYNFDKQTSKVLNGKFEEKYVYINENGNYGKGEKVLQELSFKYLNGKPQIVMNNLYSLSKVDSNYIAYAGPNIKFGSFSRFGIWEYYNKNGVLQNKSNYNFITNKLEGTSIRYSANGKVKSKGKFDENGKKTGIWEIYYENGNVSEEVPYENDKIQGVVIGYYENKNKKSKVAYADNKIIGIKELYFPSGKLLGKENYKDGKFASNGDFYDENGTVTLQSGNGYKLEFFDNGKMSFKGNYRNGNLHGLCSWYFENGNLKQEENYENGVANGLSKIYFVSGNLMQKTVYDKGKTNGSVEYYHPNGKLLGKNKFSNNDFKEPEDFFDENGNSTLSNGSGYLLQYYNNGKISNRANYLNYCRSGKVTWYYNNGQIEQEAIYKYSETQKPFGLRWEVLTGFDINGNEREIGTLKNGNGTWITYDENGKKIVTEYKNGLQINK